MKGESWGRYPKVSQQVRMLEKRQQNPFRSKEELYLPYGQGRSYGDCCLNDGGVLIGTRWLDSFIEFDRDQGVLRCEAGVTLAQVLELVLPAGWFLPVTPGTKFVSVGGALANDVHGKNHHGSGTFGCFVRRFELLRSTGERLICSDRENAALFSATIGGLGLTGLITWVEFSLKRAPGPWIEMESVRFGNLEEFFGLSQESDKEFEYTVAWLDCVSAGANFGRGIFMRGRHVPSEAHPKRSLLGRLSPKVPIDLPSLTLNPLTVRAFNELYYRKQRQRLVKKLVHYDPFFYPLDAVSGWNRIYGSRGFLQFQCVVPSSGNSRPIAQILSTVVENGDASFLAVLKEFGDISSPGMLSFPRRGVTLCLDIPFRGTRTLNLFARLDEMTRDFGGAIYPAKDATMSAESFQQYFPRWKEVAALKDPRCSSSLWRRVTGLTQS
ncbi:MAG: FAD-binding oxidoreductase [Bdellovibrionota bacterium]|nr:MAG: FAD-binding oxidoreductase [Bdellovibrionota bacterium]